MILESAVDRCFPLETRMHIDILDHEAAHLSGASAMPPIEPPCDALAALLLLAGRSQPRRRALPARPIAAHSDASNYGL